MTDKIIENHYACVCKDCGSINNLDEYVNHFINQAIQKTREEMIKEFNEIIIWDYLNGGRIKGIVFQDRLDKLREKKENENNNI